MVNVSAAHSLARQSADYTIYLQVPVPTRGVRRGGPRAHATDMARTWRAHQADAVGGTRVRGCGAAGTAYVSILPDMRLIAGPLKMSGEP